MPRSALVMFCLVIRSGRERSSGGRVTPTPTPVPGFYAGPFPERRREPPAEFSPVLDNGCETLEIDAVHAFRGFPLLRQDMDHRDLGERSRNRYPPDVAGYAARLIVDALFELRGAASPGREQQQIAEGGSTSVAPLRSPSSPSTRCHRAMRRGRARLHAPDRLPGRREASPCRSSTQ